MNFKKQVEASREHLIQSVQDLIHIRSVKEKGTPGKPFGEGMNEALLYVLQLAEKMGFRVQNLDGYCGYAEYGEGDLYIGVLSHVDIYQEGEMWVLPPYEARIMNNRIYGRGAMDNKGPLLAALFGLYALKTSGKKLNKKIRLIIGTDEERYYEDMQYYLKKEKPPIAGFTLDGQFPVVFAEKGLAMMEYRGEFKQGTTERIEYIKGGTAENTVPGHCEALLITQRKSEIVAQLTTFAKENRHNMSAKIVEQGVLIESFGVETHSMALEKGINAISQMIRFLVHIRFGEEAIANLLRFLDETIGFYIYGEGLGIDCEDEFSGRLTTNLGILSVENDQTALRLDIRYPVTCDFEETAKQIKAYFLQNGFYEYENTFWNPVYFPQEHFLIKALLQAYREVTKDSSEPIASGSGSYSKVMPNIAAFGAIFPGESEAWHQINEYIDIDNLLTMTEIYANAMYQLATQL